MERIVRALDVHGLVNAQFIVREDGVYLIEVNPRASRTVPFMSKVTGVPMVELAVRIALGEKLADMGWPNGLLAAASFVAVKAPAFSTAKLLRRGSVAGPVHAVHRRGDRDPRGSARRHGEGARWAPRSSRRARAPAGRSRCCRSPTATRRCSAALAEALAKAGYRFAATPGTRAALARARLRGGGRGEARRRGRPRARCRSWTSSRRARSGSS